MQIECPECLKNKNCKPVIKNGKCLNYEIDNVKYYQHKYYRSCLLPSIVEAMGETSKQYTHDFKLKPWWLAEEIGYPFYEYKNYNDIPVKFQETGKIWQLENGNFAVIPSMSRFTIKEAKSFIAYCEKLLFVELNGHINIEYQDEAKYCKDRLNERRRSA